MHHPKHFKFIVSQRGVSFDDFIAGRDKENADDSDDRNTHYDDKRNDKTAGLLLDVYELDSDVWKDEGLEDEFNGLEG